MREVKIPAIQKVLIILLLTIGVTIAVLKFLSNRSLWLDECYISINIIKRSSIELLKPLDMWQVAPILFLQIEKFISILIPNSELGLRLFPLISFCISLFFFYLIINFIFQNKITIIFALSCFVFSSAIMEYSNEVKQYMSDLLLLCLVYFILLKKFQIEKYRFILLAIIGIVGIWISNVAPIILSTAGLFLLIRNKSKYFIFLLTTSLFWGISFIIYYYLFINHHPLKDFMINLWQDSFMPLNPFEKRFYLFFYSKIAMICTQLFQLGYFGKMMIPILLIVGVLTTYFKKKYGIINFKHKSAHHTFSIVKFKIISF